MRVHLITMIGHSITTLKPLLEHYSRLGVDSFWVYVHMDKTDKVFADLVASLTFEVRGVEIFPVSGDLIMAEQKVLASISAYPHDWFILADQDEFHLYPSDLTEVLEECDRGGFDHINGCFVDRIAEDGSLRALDLSQPIWGLYPVGVFLTQPVCCGIVRKVVAAKGSVKIAPGHHYAIGGTSIPISQLFVEVHHFKWIAGVEEYLRNRILPNSREGSIDSLLWLEGQRFLRYFASNKNKVNLQEPALMAALCNPHYPHWEVVTKLCLIQEFSARMRSRERVELPVRDIRLEDRVIALCQSSMIS